jgi:fructokinase
VLCFGEALLDRLGAPGQDPAAGGDDRLGGAPANVACGLARLGTPAAFLGRLGEDRIGRTFGALFQERGVDISGLQWDPARPSRTVLVRRDASGERSFAGFATDGAANPGAGDGSAEPGVGFADQAVDLETLLGALPPLLGAARWLVVGSLCLASPAPAAALEGLLPPCAAAGLGLAVDVNWRPVFWGLAPECPPPPAARAAIGALLERADLIKFAREEADGLFGPGADPAAIARALPRQPAVLITDGPRPLRWWWAGQAGEQGALAVPVVDTTGAGDAFMAGLLHQLCARQNGHGAPLPEPRQLAAALRFAAACGALTCTAAGAIDGQPTAAGVDRLLRETAGHLA